MNNIIKVSTSESEKKGRRDFIRTISLSLSSFPLHITPTEDGDLPYTARKYVGAGLQWIMDRRSY